MARMADAKPRRGRPHVQARVEPDLVARLDALVAAIDKAAPPGSRPYQRSDAVRAAMLAGLPILEAHYGITPKPPKEKKPARKPAAK